MMSKPGASLAGLGAALLAVVVLCAVATASASAGWFIEKTELTGTAALSSTASVTEHFRLKAAGSTIECLGSSVTGTSPELRTGATIAAASLTFSECKVGEPCKLATKTIGSVPVSAEAGELAYPEAKAVFTPKTKTTFATIKFEGATCALLGVQPLTGKITTTMPTGQEEKAAQLVKAHVTEASGELKLGSSAAEFVGAAEVKLASGKTWELNKPAPPAPRLEKVDFTNTTEVVIDHRENTVPEGALKILQLGAKNDIEWESTTPGEVAKNWPLSFVKGQHVLLEGRAALEPATRTFLEERLEGEVTLTGEMTFGGTSLVFTKKLTEGAVATQLVEHNTYLTTGVIAAGNVLPNKVLYERPTMNWTWTAKEIGRANAFKQTIGTSVHNIYTTFAEPKETDYLTLLDLATQGIAEEAGEPTETKTIAGTWKGFSHTEGEPKLPTVHLRTYKPKSTNGELSRAGKAMEYYTKVEPKKNLEQLRAIEIFSCSAFGTAGLLEQGEGNCVAWREAMKSTLAIEGLTSTPVRIYVKFGAACAVINECVMLINTWKFGAAGMGEFPYKANELIDEEGIAGQNNSNPPPFFNNHALLKAGPNLYDPSYGTGPFNGKEGLAEGETPTEKSVLKEVQAKAIAGYCEPLVNTCQKTPAALELVAEPGFEFP